MNAPARISPYLSGNFAPVREEVTTCGSAGSRACCRRELSGTYFRNGPNPQFDPRDANYHWFAGDGMIHAFSVADGKVSYQNRYVRTPKWELENKAGKALFGTFGNPMTSDPSVMSARIAASPTPTSSGTRASCWRSRKGISPSNSIRARSAERLSRLCRRSEAIHRASRRSIRKPANLSSSAIPSAMMPFSQRCAYGVVDKNGKVTRLETFEAPFASMIHDFFVTENYVLFPVLPLTGSMERAMSGQAAVRLGAGEGRAYRGDAPRSGVKSMRWFTTDACYVFHPMNMYEDRRHDLSSTRWNMRTRRSFPTPMASWARIRRPILRAGRFDLTGQSVKRTQIDDLAGEFPRFDERLRGLAYRHGYFAGNSRDDGKVQFDSIAHVDHQTGARTLYQVRRRRCAGRAGVRAAQRRCRRT